MSGGYCMDDRSGLRVGVCPVTIYRLTSASCAKLLRLRLLFVEVLFQ